MFFEYTPKFKKITKNLISPSILNKLVSMVNATEISIVLVILVSMEINVGMMYAFLSHVGQTSTVFPVL